jgi:hypothetical protein
VRRKLLLLEIVLLASVVLAGGRVREKWLEARKREAAVLGRPLKPLPPPPYSPSEPPERLTAGNYLGVAEHMLFTADRNPTVVVEVAPPKPMPALPVVYGVIDLGEGPLAIMSVKPGASHEEVRRGEKIGEFVLMALNAEEITLDWDGQAITKRVVDLVDRSAPPPAPSGQQAAAAGPVKPQVSVTGPQRTGPGDDVGTGIRRCIPGDPTPVGTIVNGYRKAIVRNPMGEICRWEPVK